MTDNENGKTTDYFIGKKVADYELVKLLGAGGMGAVYLGEHKQMGQAAVKLLPIPNPALRERFESEVDVLVKMTKLGLKHLAGVMHYEAPSETSPGGMIMPYLEGQPLNEYLHENLDKLARRDFRMRVFRGLIPVIADLEVAHDLGVIHRDIKPENIMVRNPSEETGELNMCLFDFGISRPSTTSQMTRAGMQLGTPVWSAPEQFKDASKAGSPADVFPFGLMFYLLFSRDNEIFYSELEGNEEISPRDVLAIIRNVEGVEEKLVKLPIEVAGLVSKCITENPDHRFRGMRELKGACLALHESYRLHRIGGSAWGELSMQDSTEIPGSGRSMTQQRTLLHGSGASSRAVQNKILTVADDAEETEKVEPDAETREMPIEEIAPFLAKMKGGFTAARRIPLKIILAAAIGVVVLSAASFFMGRGCESSPAVSKKARSAVAHKPNPPRKIRAKPMKSLFQELDELCQRLIRPKRGIEQKGRVTNVAHCILKRILKMEGNLEAKVQATFALEKKYYDKVYPNMKRLITKRVKYLESKRNKALEKKPPDK